MIISFKTWLLTEDFKSQRQKFIKQGIPDHIVDQYLKHFDAIRKSRPKEAQTFDLPNVKDRWNIDMYKDFHDLEQLVDFVKGQRKLAAPDVKQTKTTETHPNLVHEDDTLQIFYGDSAQSCANIKGAGNYGWCVARKDSGNMFNVYRHKGSEPAFYFVKNKKKPETDKYHFFVIQVKNNKASPEQDDWEQPSSEEYVVTSAENDGDIEKSWGGVLKIEPHLKKLKHILKPRPLTTKEKENYKRFAHGMNDQAYADLSYEDKEQYIEIYHRLGTEQFINSPEALKNKYITMGRPLDSEMFEFIENNKNLMKRYKEVAKQSHEQGVNLRATQIYVLRNDPIFEKLSLWEYASEYVDLLLYRNETIPNHVLNLVAQLDNREVAEIAIKFVHNTVEIPKQIIDTLCEEPSDAFWVAREFGRQGRVPKPLIYAISQDVFQSAQYAEFLDYNSVPEEIMRTVSHDANDCFRWAAQKLQGTRPEILHGLSQDKILSTQYAAMLKKAGLPIPNEIKAVTQPAYSFAKPTRGLQQIQQQGRKTAY